MAGGDDEERKEPDNSSEEQKNARFLADCMRVAAGFKSVIVSNKAAKTRQQEDPKAEGVPANWTKRVLTSCAKEAEKDPHFGRHG